MLQEGLPTSVNNSLNDLHRLSYAQNQVTNDYVTPVNMTSTETVRCCKLSEKLKKKIRRAFSGFLVALSVSFCWTMCCVGASQTYKRSAYDIKYNESSTILAAPFFLTYCATSCLIICYPIYIIIYYIQKQEMFDIQECMKRDLLILDGEQSKWSHLATRCSLFSVLWVTSSYCLFRSFYFLTVMDFVTVYSVQPCYIYLLCWIILHKKFIAMRVVAFIFGNSGVIMYIYLETRVVWYKIMGTFAAGSLAIFRVLFRRISFYPTAGQYCLFLTSIGLCNLATMWPIVLILSVFTNVEPIIWSNYPWNWFSVTIACYLVYHVMIFTLHEVTYKFFINFGVLQAIALSAVVETFWLPSVAPVFPPMKIVGLCLIIQAFFMTSLPNNWHKFIVNFVKSQRKNSAPNVAGNNNGWKNRPLSASNNGGPTLGTRARIKSLTINGLMTT